MPRRPMPRRPRRPLRPNPARRIPRPRSRAIARSAMRVFNFAPGPAALPTEVMAQAREEFVDWQASGMSVMEISHRGKAFMRVAAEAEADLRELLGLPKSYKVLFMQGGASAQFSIVPLNLTGSDSSTDYIDTGHW